MFERIIEIQTQAGTPVEIHGSGGSPLTIIPLSKAITLHLPIVTAIWNRPFAVELHDGQNYQQLSIPDATRTVQLALLALSFMFFGITLLQLISKRKA